MFSETSCFSIVYFSPACYGWQIRVQREKVKETVRRSSVGQEVLGLSQRFFLAGELL